ncbi:amidohydrolase [Cytobacillus depressus]|uniref:Amidohydrolase n=1 Tax=Cytobacillus depressus TaxID=1602942 RepID=A0A6L3V4Q9_9BACI|nr:amidohydrolase [Cytobacillus depressus]KAB2333329.1 amidohydrolase [Cytobacillus depressus]
MKTTDSVQCSSFLIDSLESAKQVEQYVISLRRDFHMHPEVGLQEKRTIKVVTEELRKMGVAYEIVPNGGVIGIIEGEEQGKSLILRADLDALPMQEDETNLKDVKQVVSKYDGVSHTCGHDGHTAMLLGTAKILSQNRNKIKGKVILAFEQAEEIGGGIIGILQRLIEIGADGVWGIHLKSDIPSGKISVDPGPRMSSAFAFNIILKGIGGHGSRPDLTHSPLDCFTDFYNHLKMMRLNALDPFKAITYSIGSIYAGSAANVIPDTLQFSGTVRYLQYDQGVKAEQEFKRILEKTCELHHCTYEYINEPKARDLCVYNQEDCAAIALSAVKNSIGEQAVYPYPAWMASEPFSYYQKYFPGVFSFVGIQNEEKGTGAEHHNPKFDMDEDVLKLGVAATLQYTFEFLGSDVTINFQPETKNLKELKN